MRQALHQLLEPRQPHSRGPYLHSRPDRKQAKSKQINKQDCKEGDNEVNRALWWEIDQPPRLPSSHPSLGPLRPSLGLPQAQVLASEAQTLQQSVLSSGCTSVPPAPHNW